MATPTDRQDKVIQLGGQARVALSVMEAKIEQLRQVRMGELLTTFRQGGPAEKLLAPVASLAAIDELTSMLLSDLRNARAVEQRLEGSQE